MHLTAWLADLFPTRTQHCRSRRRAVRSRQNPVVRQGEVLEDRVLLTTLTVDSLADTVADDGVTTLREAIQSANNSFSSDTIVFETSLSEGTIVLDGTELPTINDNLTIEGLGAGQLTIDAGGLSRIFRIAGARTVGISGLTLTGGDVGFGNGGAIFNDGILTVTDSIFTGNAAYRGGAVFNNFHRTRAVTTTIVGSTLTGNFATLRGGAIENFQDEVIISASVIHDNSTNGDGGGIHNTGTLTIIDSTLSENSADSLSSFGGGIYNTGTAATVEIVSSTLSGNSAENRGGGIWANGGAVSISQSTISGNSAGNGGGIHSSGDLTVVSSTIVLNQTATGGDGGLGGGGILMHPFQGTTTLHNTIVAGNGRGLNMFPDDLAGSVVDAASSHNLIGSAGSRGGLSDGVNGNIVGVGGVGVIGLNTVLDTTLGDNGGPMFTHSLVAGSPARDAGDNSLIPVDVTTDQRGPGFPRVIGSTVDIGAIETGAFSNTPPTANDGPETSGDSNYATGEDSLLIITAANGVLANDVDPDTGDLLQVVSITGSANGGLVSMNANGSFTYDPNGQFALLAVGETATDTFEYTVSDTAGETDTATVTITIHGENDAPTIAGPVSATSDEDAAGFDVDLLAGTDDVDASDTLSLANLALIAGDVAGVSINGSILHIDPAAYDYLAAGESEVITYSYDVVDGNGGSVAQTATATIEGRNDGPVIVDVFTSAGSLGDIAQGESVSLAASFFDVDLTDTHTAVIDWGDGTTSSGFISPSPGGGTIAAAHVYENGGVYEIVVTLSDSLVSTETSVGTAFISGVGVNNDGVLQVVGTNTNDAVVVLRFFNRYYVVSDFVPLQSFGTSGISGFEMLLGDGDDLVIVTTSAPVLIDGGAGNDILYGGSGDNTLLGGDGNDILFGGSGSNVLDGGAGDDTLIGGRGTDILRGGAGNDLLDGGRGDDLLIGGDGDDRLIGGRGRNILIGGSGSDQLIGQPGANVLIGGATIYDDDDEALSALLAEWSSNNSYADRVENLANGGGANGAFHLELGLTVLDDGEADAFFSDSSDWLFES